jgi:hypothetical protein
MSNPKKIKKEKKAETIESDHSHQDITKKEKPLGHKI